MKRLCTKALLLLVPLAAPSVLLESCIVEFPGLGAAIFTTNSDNGDLEDAVDELED